LIRPTHKVRVEPPGIELEIKDGQTIFRVANETGIGWPTRCGGAKSCTMCTMIVLEGEDNLSKPDDDESLRVRPLARIAGIDPIRLRMACAARVRGPAVVQPRYRVGADGPVEAEGATPAVTPDS
jgi:ferredoxin, 2Fe-2S